MFMCKYFNSIKLIYFSAFDIFIYILPFFFYKTEGKGNMCIFQGKFIAYDLKKIQLAGILNQKFWNGI